MQQDEGVRGEYGQETWYQDNQEDANARFLEDLILNQMYDGKLPEQEGDKRQRWAKYTSSHLRCYLFKLTFVRVQALKNDPSPCEFWH